MRKAGSKQVSDVVRKAKKAADRLEYDRATLRLMEWVTIHRFEAAKRLPDGPQKEAATLMAHAARIEADMIRDGLPPLN